jgi:serine/threonine protein kinase/tetratricopeptide (TPR) repeat protein
MIGEKLAHYRILEKIGTGGMGQVYRAQDELLRRTVAIKILPDEIASHAERRARILAEARAAAALNHPGITTIYEVGEEGDQIFIVMELVPGKTVRTVLSEGPVESRVLLRLGAQVAEALAAAHAQGVIHGDIKPENIVLQSEGRIKLLDFGIASQMNAETITLSRTSTTASWVPDSQIAGTLAYMAPEQLLGGPADARADLFSLGVLLYELSAGHRPFPGPTASVLVNQILQDTPPPLRAATSIVPSELVRIVHKLLEKQPERRYQSAREVQVDLTNLGRDLELGLILPDVVASKRGVAVLPFKLLTPSAEDEYLSVALADAIINQLGASGELLVRPTSTVMRYAKQPVDPLLAARELNVQVVVDGSIQKFGQKLRVHVQAWNAADGATLLSGKHDSDLSDLFGLQDRISDALARALGAKPAAEGPAEPPTKNPAAYQLFLRAVERIQRFNRWDTGTAIEMLENATQLDPRFADAWARLAEACLLVAISFDPNPKWIHQAERAVRRALALDPANVNALCARGRVLWAPAKGFQHRAAVRALDKALRLNPGCHQAWLWTGIVYCRVGLHQEAIEKGAVAVASNPDDPMTVWSLGHSKQLAGEFEEALDYFARTLALEPSHVWGNIFFPGLHLYSGRLDRAEEKIRVAAQLVPNDPLVASWEALLWAKRGEPRKAEHAARRALSNKRVFTYSHHAYHAVAAAYAVIGKPARALSALKKAAGTGLPNYPLFRDDPHFASLRNHPQFLRLLAGLNRAWQSYKREFGRHETA